MVGAAGLEPAYHR